MHPLVLFTLHFLLLMAAAFVGYHKGLKTKTNLRIQVVFGTQLILNTTQAEIEKELRATPNAAGFRITNKAISVRVWDENRTGPNIAT